MMMVWRLIKICAPWTEKGIHLVELGYFILRLHLWFIIVSVLNHGFGNLLSEGYFRVLARCRKFKKIIIFNIFKVVPFKYIATKILEAAYKIPNLCKNVIKMFQV